METRLCLLGQLMWNSGFSLKSDVLQQDLFFGNVPCYLSVVLEVLCYLNIKGLMPI